MASSIDFRPINVNPMPNTGSSAPAIDFQPMQAPAAPTGGITFAPDNEGQGYHGSAGEMNLSGLKEFVRPLGLAARAYGPTAASAALGAGGASLLMGPEMAPLGAAAGMAAYQGSKLIGDPLVGAYNYVKPDSWPALTPPTQGINNALDTFLPKPETTGERYANAINTAIADSVSMTGGGPVKGIASLFQAAQNPVTKGVGEVLASQPVQQAGMSVLSGIGGQTAEEIAPGSTAARVFGSLALPLAGVGMANAARGAVNYLGPEEVGAFAQNLRNGLGAARQAATDVYKQNAAAKSLQETAGSPADRAAAVAALDAAPELTANGYKPTTGTLSGNPNLISQEKRLANSGDLKGSSGESLLARHVNNTEAITGGVNKAMAPSDVNVDVAQNYMAQQLAAEKAAAENAAKSAQTGLSTAERDLAQQQAELRAKGTDTVRTQASSKVRSSLETQHDDFREMADELYAKVPKATKVDLTSSRKFAERMVKAAQGTIGGVPPEVQQFLEVTKKGSLSAVKAQRNLEDLYAAVQQQAPGSPAAKALNDLREALDKDISKVEAVSKPLQEARNFYREQFAPRFKQGASNAIFGQRGAGGAPAVEPGNTLNPYMASEQEASRLRSTLAGQSGELGAGDLNNVRDWTISKLASTLGENPNSTKIRAWARQNDSVLSQFPEVKAEVEGLATSIGTKEGTQNLMAQQLKARQAELSAAEKKATDSTVGKFANSGTEYGDELNRALFQEGAVAKTKELVAAAKGDRTGKSLESLKNGFKNAVSNKVRSSRESMSAGNDVGAAAPENYLTTVKKVNDLLTEGRTRRAMEQIFSPEELRALDQIRKQANVSNRLTTKAAPGSDTAANLTTGAEAKSAIGKAYWGLPLVRAAKIIQSTIDLGKAAGRAIVLKDPDLAAERLVVDAHLDPKLAQSLLMRETEANKPKIQQSILPWLNAFAGGKDNNSEDE